MTSFTVHHRGTEYTEMTLTIEHRSLSILSKNSVDSASLWLSATNITGIET